MSLADDRALCEAARPALARLERPTGWFVGPIEAYLVHFNPAYVARLLDVVEAARTLHHFLWEEKETTAPPDDLLSAACVACESSADYEREEQLTMALGDALAALKAVDDA